jgi:hypothetical protein
MTRARAVHSVGRVRPETTMHSATSSWLAAGLVLAASSLAAQAPSLRVTVTNVLDTPESAETVVLPAAQLEATFGAESLPRVHVAEAGAPGEVLTQAVDSDGDGRLDQLVFQTTLGPRATRTYQLTLGERVVPRKADFRVYGRFVRERFDDFAWENDLVAHRVYGPALETWAKEPLTSSGIDVWVKRTPALVVNDWYLVDDYHQDHGEGGDFYSVGPSRGCGGSGIWKDGRMFVSRNFQTSRVLANGPVRLVFELEYQSWEAGGARVAEKKRITLDAGSHFNHIESVYTIEGETDATWAIGIKKAAGAEVASRTVRGSVRTWEALKEPNGHLGCAIVIDPARVGSAVEANGNILLTGPVGSGQSVVYLVGSAWDKGGDVPGAAAWDRLVENEVRRLASPLKVEFLPR